MKGLFRKYLGVLWNTAEKPLHQEDTPLNPIVEPPVQGPSSMVKEETGPESFLRYISCRIYPNAHIEKFPSEEFYVRPFLEDTIIVLVLDYPSSIEHVWRRFTEKWAIDEQLLFDRALQNVQERYHRVVQTVEPFKTQGVLTLQGDDAFKTSALLYIEEYPALTGVHGALIIFPDKDHLMSMPLSDDIALEIGMQLFVPLVDSLYQNSEHRLSKHIFWYFDGVFQSIPYVIGINSMNYVLPFDLEDRIY
ncbi:MAG: hypothetical protein MUE33_04550 [Cytophagaceae bacterium]|jgi:hypothetical protein|nr:hypothetical protein [Cytophagaceae bacterium]